MMFPFLVFTGTTKGVIVIMCNQNSHNFKNLECPMVAIRLGTVAFKAHFIACVNIGLLAHQAKLIFHKF